MRKFRERVQKNPLLWKYGLGIATIFMMIISIKTYLNYLTIETSIEEVNKETVEITQKKKYEENFLIPFEKSKYATYFLRHENNILLPGEFIIRFEYGKEKIIKENTEEGDKAMIAQDSRQYFFEKVAEKYQQ